MLYPYPEHVAPTLVMLITLLTGAFEKAVPGATLVPYEGHRTHAEQAAYYAQGRKPLDEVNSLRRAAGLAPIRTAENAVRITWAKPGESPHNEDPSEAVDLVVKCRGVLTWNPRIDCDSDGILDYQEMGELAKEVGLAWGGRWVQRDLPHVELP